jgi:DNA-binding transcriptional MerR regulator
LRLKKTYSSREVAAITGLTARQLQALDSRGLVAPVIRPQRTAAGGYTERRYTAIELFEFFVLADLRRRGFSAHQLFLILNRLREQFGTRLFEATGGGSHVRLLTDGRDIYARTDAGEFFNLLKAPLQPLLVIGDEGLLRELKASIRPKKRPRRPR